MPPVHPNDHVNMAQSSNDSFPSAMCIAAAVKRERAPHSAVSALRDAIAAKSQKWDDIIKIGRTQHAGCTPLTLGQEWSGYVGMLSTIWSGSKQALPGCIDWRSVVRPSAPASLGAGFLPKNRRPRSPRLTGLPFVTAPNKFTVPGRFTMQTGPALRNAAHARRVALQDRERHSADVMRPTRRICQN